MKQRIQIGTATGEFDVPDVEPGGMVNIGRRGGRTRGRLKPFTMNGLEKRYSVSLEYQVLQGLIKWWRFDVIKLRLADTTFYECDFLVLTAKDELELHETKGHLEDDAAVKLKVVAATFPFRVLLIREKKRVDGGGWDIKEM